MNNHQITLTFEIKEPQLLLRDAIKQNGISKKALTSIKYEGGQDTCQWRRKNG